MMTPLFLRLLLVCALLCTSGCMTNEVMSRTEVRYKPGERLFDPGEEIPGNPAYKWLLPLAVPLDIATSPIQFLLICIIGFPTDPHVPPPSRTSRATPPPVKRPLPPRARGAATS